MSDEKQEMSLEDAAEILNENGILVYRNATVLICRDTGQLIRMTSPTPADIGCAVVREGEVKFLVSNDRDPKAIH